MHRNQRFYTKFEVMWSVSAVVYVVGLLQILLRFVLSEDSNSIPCVTPLSQTGICINIRQCDYLLQILRTQRKAAGNLLRSSICGYEGRDPRVCCPLFKSLPKTDDSSHNTVQTRTSYGPLYPGQCGFSNTTHIRVVGGIPAKLGAWPWIAALGYRDQKSTSHPLWLCAGSLVSSRHVITAAHCVYNQNDLYLVRLGDLDLNSDKDGATPIDVLIERTILHPMYNAMSYTNDIAVLRLQQEVPFSYFIHPICLPLSVEVRTKSFERHFPFLVGWGSIYYNGPSSSHLLELQLPIVEQSECQRAFKSINRTVIDNRVICAGFARGGKDSCKGDSGGPLMYPKETTFYLIGVISYGFRCAEPGFPGVYTRVTSFLDFIEANLI